MPTDRAFGYLLGGVPDRVLFLWKGLQLHPEVLLVAALLVGLLAWDATNRHQQTCGELAALFRDPSHGPGMTFTAATALVLRYPQISKALDSCGFDLLSLTS